MTAHYGVHYSYGMQYGAGPKPFGYIQTVSEPKHFFAYDLEGSGQWRNLLHSGFESCFGPSTQGVVTKTHLKSRFCSILEILIARCLTLLMQDEKMGSGVRV